MLHLFLWAQLREDNPGHLAAYSYVYFNRKSSSVGLL